MSDPASPDAHSNSTPNSEGATGEQSGQKPKSKQIQLTFQDFNNIKSTAKSPEALLEHANKMLETNRRRSRRVVPKRPVEDDEDDMPRATPKKKKKPVAKAKESNINRDAIRERAKKQQQSVQNPEPLLMEENWSPNVPLQSSDFKNHYSIVSRFRSPNMKPVPYAKYVIQIMTFINKFNKFLPRDVWSLSFQDFELGLDLYPDTEKDTSHRLYQDYLPIKEVVKCQDVMNLLFLSLMKLALNNNTPTTMKLVTSTPKSYSKFLNQLRANAWSWGYPKEWKVTVGDINTKVFPVDDTEPVDPSNREILTPNLPTWPQQYAIDNDPLLTPELEKSGIQALLPQDRIVLLKALVQWCLAQSDKIHTEVFRLSHLKRDAPYGVPTHHVPRSLSEGILPTKAKFRRLCDLVQARLEIKSAKKHVKKQLEHGKRADLSQKLALIDSIYQERYRAQENEGGETPTQVDLFDDEFERWCEVIGGELADHPMSSPYEDEIFRLRSLEFFIGRVPHVGDFYIPRLHTYQDGNKQTIPTTYTDPKTLQKTLDALANNKIDAFTLFTQNGKMMSTQFKLFYHDSPSMIRDAASQVDTSSKNYWYEMCHDCATLREFLTLIDYKLNLLETAEKEPANKGVMNKNPLPKESKFNASREKLRIIKEYLVNILPLLAVYEELGANYEDMETSGRTLRRSQRKKSSYSNDESDDGSSDEIMPEEKDEAVSEDFSQEPGAGGDDEFKDENGDDDYEDDEGSEGNVSGKRVQAKRGRGRPRGTLRGKRGRGRGRGRK